MGPVPRAGTPLAAGVLLLSLAVGCADDASDERGGPEETALPAGLTAYVDQSRMLRQTRTAFVRLVNEPERFVTVLRAEVFSPRFGEVTWTGEKTFQNEADLEFEVPTGRCGEGSDAEVRLTYRVDDGPEQVSETTATDRYGAIGLFLDRDCAAQTFAEAATLDLGETRVVGRGRESVFELPVTMTPTGERDDVAFGGFEDTVLFRGTEGSPTVGTTAPVPLGVDDPPVEVVLRLVPTRCDPHALAEDKVGTLIGVRTLAPGLSEVASFHLPIGDARRGELRGFFAVHCGL
ncbi:hypothetical protein [Nocardioides dongkuii]|uniref:hypothetical protein n=1 Tax=Nocardioides dongkuii TaxID=2760089 RepID=UPI0015FC2C42|nr:hypothetical protein [Nocardioides dongkuii]